MSSLMAKLNEVTISEFDSLIPRSQMFGSTVMCLTDVSLCGSPFDVNVNVNVSVSMSYSLLKMMTKTRLKND